MGNGFVLQPTRIRGDEHIQRMAKWCVPIDVVTMQVHGVLRLGTLFVRKYLEGKGYQYVTVYHNPETGQYGLRFHKGKGAKTTHALKLNYEKRNGGIMGCSFSGKVAFHDYASLIGKRFHVQFDPKVQMFVLTLQEQR